MKLSDIRPYEQNPRLNDDAVDAVARSIKEFGWQQPIVVAQEHVIIVGHTRLKAAEKLGLTEVPVLVADNLTPEQVKAYRIADNKTGEIAEWNYDLLPVEIKDLQDANFDLSLLGFDTDELDRLLNGTSADEVTDGETEPDAVPEVPEEAGQAIDIGHSMLSVGHSVAIAFNEWLGLPEFENWRRESFRKVVCQADEKVFEAVKTKLADEDIPFKVCGEEFFGPDTEIALVVFPLEKEYTPRCLLFLQPWGREKKNDVEKK